MTDLTKLAVLDLLNLHAGAIEELRTRGILRSANNPVGDYSEFLFCRAFGWTQAGNSEKDTDAIGPDGIRYQIKGRRLATPNSYRQLGALRRLPEGNFGQLAAVLFNLDFSILRAAMIPHVLVLENSKYVEATNSWKFMLRDEVWGWEGVRDVTGSLRRASSR